MVQAVVVWLMLVVALAGVSRWRRGVRLSAKRPETETGIGVPAAWPVERYVIGAGGSGACGTVEAATVRTTWPQVAQWAAQRSLSSAVDEVCVIRVAPEVSVWAWRDGKQVRHVPAGHWGVRHGA